MLTFGLVSDSDDTAQNQCSEYNWEWQWINLIYLCGTSRCDPPGVVKLIRYNDRAGQSRNRGSISDKKRRFISSEAPRLAQRPHPAAYSMDTPTPTTQLKLLYTSNNHCLPILHGSIFATFFVLHVPTRTVGRHENDRTLSGSPVSRLGIQGNFINLGHSNTPHFRTVSCISYYTHFGLFLSGFHLKVGMYISFLPSMQHSL